MNSTDPDGCSRCRGILVTLWRYYYIIADAGGASPASARGLLRNLGERAGSASLASARGLLRNLGERAGSASLVSARGLSRNLGERACASFTVSARGLCFYYKAKNIVYYDK